MRGSFKKIFTSSAFALAFTGQVYANEPVIIGVIGPYTGPAAANGDLMRDAANAFQKYTNENGGVLGRALQIKFYDDVCDPKSGKEASNKADADGTMLLVGPFCSVVTNTVKYDLRERKAVNITLSQSDSVTGEDYPGLFRITPSNAALSEKIIEALRETQKSSVYILHVNDEYGHNLSTLIGSALAETGLELKVDKFMPREVDFAPVATKAINEGVDTVSLAGSAGDIANVARALRSAGYQGRIIMPGTGTLEEYPAVVGCPAIENSFAIAADDRTFEPQNAYIIDALKSAGVKPRDNILFTWSALDVLTQAIERAGSEAAVLVAEEIRGGIFETPQGTLDFVSSGALTGNLENPLTTKYEWTCLNGRPDLVKR